MSDRVVAIVQARMASTRLPGKVLKEILGKPILAYLIERIKNSNSIDDLVIATTTNLVDELIVEYCIANNVQYFRGSENDVLSRYTGAAIASNADYVVRICSDSPIVDSDLINEIVNEFKLQRNNCDYLSNTIDQTYPLGMNIEIFSFEALSIADQNASTLYEREHVTPYIYFNKDRFRVLKKNYYKNVSSIRLTLDELDDFRLIQNVIEHLYPKDKYFTLEQILDFLEKNPDMLKINQHVKQKQGL